MNKAALSMVMALKLACCAAGAWAQDDLYIDSPADGSKLSADSLVQIVVKQRSSLPRFYFNKLVAVSGSRGIQVSGPTVADPYLFVAKLPPNAIGAYTLQAFGIGENSLLSASKPIRVVVSGPKFSTLTPSVSMINIRYPGDTGSDVSVYGITADGSKVVIPSALLTITSADPTLASFSGATPLGLKVGIANVSVTYGDLVAQLKVNVSPIQIKGDLNGDGYVDRQDIDVLNAQINRPAVSPYDERDLNKDGRIDALDLRVLTTLCTKPRCAAQ